MIAQTRAFRDRIANNARISDLRVMTVLNAPTLASWATTVMNVQTLVSLVSSVSIALTHGLQAKIATAALCSFREPTANRHNVRVMELVLNSALSQFAEASLRWGL